MPIRPTTPADVAYLVPLAAATGVFKPHEIETLGSVFSDYFATAGAEEGHLCFTAEVDGSPVGFVYFCPIPMTVGSWDLWWIAVDKGRHGTGLGSGLLRYAEDSVRDAGGRVLMIDTSSTPAYAATRAFYRKHGYVATATLPDFYCDGDDKVIFWKRLASL
ncbi:MAG TPA: GNAT family N-acetyltransferase [Fimbriiglobus sp.]|jgi:ribosomal protein S18 acetylase RimI-like enzyme